MSDLTIGRARAVADFAEGYILASVEVMAPPERVFRALSSNEIIDWWVRPGVFNTTEWTGEAQVGGHWRASGEARGRPYVLEGKFLEFDPPRKLVFTWHGPGASDMATTVTYLLEGVDGGTRVTLRHAGLASRESCIGTCLGWESSFERLAEIIAAKAV